MKLFLKKKGNYFSGALTQKENQLLMFIIITILFLSALTFVLPRVGSSSYKILPSGETKTSEYPIVFYGENSSAEVITHIWLGKFHPTLYRVVPDNCIEKLWVNGKEVYDSALPVCDYQFGHIFDLSSYVQQGDNEIKAHIKNTNREGGMFIKAIIWNEAFMVLLFLYGCSLVLLFGKNFQEVQRYKDHFLTVCIVLAGAGVRLLYWVNTPYTVRSHDAYGHVQYIFHMLNHWTIPPAQAGWEFYQPPLYYFIASIFVWPIHFLGFDKLIVLDGVALFSCCIAILAFVICAFIAYELFPKKSQCKERYLFLMVLAFFPGLLFVSSRISNDTFLQPIAFAYALYLLRWWKRGSDRDWYISVIFLGLGILTKANALPYILISGISLCCRNKTPFQNMKKYGIKSVLLLFLLTGWLYAYRFVLENENHIVGNISGNSGGLMTTVDVKNFIVVRPTEVIQHPYNSAWGDEYGRNRLWEHSIKSAFTGEWNFGTRINGILRIIHSINFLLLLSALYGIYKNARKQPYGISPLLLMIVVPFLSVAALLINTKVGGFQDFRYFNIVAIPITYYVLIGTQLLPKKVGRLLRVLLMAWIALMILYLSLLIAGP